MIKGRHSELVKVVLARCSRYITDTCIDPVELLASLKIEGQNAYQFCIQPPDAPAYSPEQLFHRKYLNISNEALAGTRARGKTWTDDYQILLCGFRLSKPIRLSSSIQKGQVLFARV